MKKRVQVRSIISFQMFDEKTQRFVDVGIERLGINLVINEKTLESKDADELLQHLWMMKGKRVIEAIQEEWKTVVKRM